MKSIRKALAEHPAWNIIPIGRQAEPTARVLKNYGGGWYRVLVDTGRRARFNTGPTWKGDDAVPCRYEIVCHRDGRVAQADDALADDKFFEEGMQAAIKDAIARY